MPAAAFPLSGTIEPTRLSPSYRGALLVITVAMVLLPVLYLLLVAGAAFLVWWHLTSNTWMLDIGGQWLVIAYIAPAVIGVTLVFFMIKPVLARPAKQPDPTPLDRKNEPVLFALIETICQQVGAPPPARVQVDCQVNASASFSKGPLGVFGRDLTLTIGLPLVAGLSVREFGGVLAHEFGHFAQGGGMRLTMIVRAVNAWFVRVVYQRDHWDEKLEGQSKRGDFRLILVLMLARAFIWMSRLGLKALMTAGHAISCFMMRQMEYDADSYEIKFGGSAAFVRTCTRLRELNAGRQLGYGDLQRAWQTGELPQNLPVFLTERVSRIPDAILTEVRRVPEAKAKWFDTHPADSDRVKAAEAAASPGILIGGDGPATELFSDFEAIAAQATRHHYEHDLGLDLNAVNVLATGQVIAESDRRRTDREAIDRFFAGRFSLDRPLHLPLADADRLDAAGLHEAMAEAQVAMRSRELQLAGEYARFDGLGERADKAFIAEELLLAGVTIDASAFELAEPTFDVAKSTQAWALDQRASAVGVLERFEQAAARSLACAVVMATRQGSTEARATGEALNLVGSGLQHVCQARRYIGAFNTVASVAQTVPNAHVRAETLIAQAQQSLEQVRVVLGDAPCPRGLTIEPTTLARQCGFLPDGQIERDAVQRTFHTYFDLLARTTALTAR